MSAQHDPARYARLYERAGRLHIPDFLDESDARRLYDALARRTPWGLLFQMKDETFRVAPERLSIMGPRERDALDRQIGACAAGAYAARFRHHRVTGAARAVSHVPELRAAADLLSGADFGAFVHAVTQQVIVGADTMAVCYAAGDFLHPQDGVAAARRGRALAFVLDLTPVWRAEWGGLLAFVDSDGHLAEAYRPAWNALTLLRLPSARYVTAVAPFAPERRFALTGWLRDVKT